MSGEMAQTDFWNNSPAKPSVNKFHTGANVVNINTLPLRIMIVFTHPLR